MKGLLLRELVFEYYNFSHRSEYCIIFDMISDTVCNDFSLPINGSVNDHDPFNSYKSKVEK